MVTPTDWRREGWEITKRKFKIAAVRLTVIEAIEAVLMGLHPSVVSVI